MLPINPSETLSRFILQKQHWYKEVNPQTKSLVKYAVFMPNPNNGETSVFRTSDISDDEIWDIGDCEVSVKRGKPVLGRADIISNIVISRDLVITPIEPPERHANITGWPDERSKQRLMALELAAEASLYLR